MQHNKSTKRIEQIEKISQNDKQITQSISGVNDKFKDIGWRFLLSSLAKRLNPHCEAAGTG